MRVLIIEDNESVSKTIRFVLSKYNHEFLCISSLKEALEKIEEYLPNVIILDLGLPDSSGIDTVKCIKEKIYSETLLIIYTSNPYIFKEVMEIGVDNFLLKGAFDPSDLPNVLEMAKINHRFNNVLKRHKKIMQGEETTWPGKSVDTNKIGDGLILLANELKTVVDSG